MDTNQRRAMAPSLTGPSSHPFESRRLSSRRRCFLRDASGVGSWRRFRSSLPCRLGSIFPLSLISLAHCGGRCCFVSGSDHWDDRQHKHPLPSRCIRVYQNRINSTVEPGDHATWVHIRRAGRVVFHKSPLLLLAPGLYRGGPLPVLWHARCCLADPRIGSAGLRSRRAGQRSALQCGLLHVQLFVRFSGLPWECRCRMWHPVCSQVRTDNLDELVRVQLRRFR